MQLTNTPPEDPRGPSLPITRTPAGRPLAAIITSSDLVGTPTHFWGGRTVPCGQDQCDACEHGVPWRWHGYVSAYNPDQQRHFLFEFTAATAEQLVSYRKLNASLRGCQFKAERPSRTANGRVMLTLKPADLDRYTIPNEPDLIAVLCILWNIPREEATTGRPAKESPRVAVANPNAAVEDAIERALRHANGAGKLAVVLPPRNPHDAA